LVEQLDGKGKYVELIGSPGSHAVEERSRGFHEVVDQYEGLEMIAQVSGNFHYSESMSAIEDVLAANPGPIDALYTHFDDMALGALEAIKNDGRVGEIMIVSANAGSKAFLEEVREGNAHAGVVYPTLGRKGVETALKLINGEKVEKRISVPTFVFDQSNVDRYYNPDMVDYFLIEQK
ncbi:MAG TPA: substrate-binding domain-containing protein, partial [Candidatus Moranbacteria bacterium]|nr:substrate-binding domain-containing protein [Candidatus Moranbacteria bacterium]